MAIFRKLHTTFWSDPFVQELTSKQKLFFVYLLTNERTKQCGIYEITKRQIKFDLDFSNSEIEELILFFIKSGKIRFSNDTNEIAIGNWMKYNNSTSPKVQSCINKEFEQVKDTVLIEYVKTMDTLSQEEQEEEQEENNNKSELFSFKKSLIELGVEEQIVSDWLKVRSTKKASNTETAFKRIKSEIEKSHLSANDCIRIAVEKSWQGIQADWFKNLENDKNQQSSGKATTLGTHRIGEDFSESL